MQNYKIITDTTGDYNVEIAKELGIDMIPFPYVINDINYKHYVDQRELSAQDFYQKMLDGGMPLTSQVNPTAYEEYFRNFLEEGKELLYICFTSGMSGAYNSACLAAANVMRLIPGSKITVFDSQCASVGEASLVMNAMEKYKEGYTIEEMIAFLEEKRTKVHHWFMVDDMFHLKRGGRVPSTTASVAAALKIKPIISVDEVGKLEVKQKVRGLKNALDYMTSMTDDSTEDTKFYMIGHAMCPDRAEKIKSLIQEKHPGAICYIVDIGPVIGAHVGPGMCALAFMS